MHQTGHNSGVVHAGIYYAPGSMKARMCVEGARRLYALCEERGIEYERCGKLIVATSPDELPGLDELERRGQANAVPGLRRLDAAAIAEVEPHCRGVAALHSPATGIVDFGRVAQTLADEVRERGGGIVLGREVTGARREDPPGRRRARSRTRGGAPRRLLRRRLVRSPRRRGRRVARPADRPVSRRLS